MQLQFKQLPPPAKSRIAPVRPPYTPLYATREPDPPPLDFGHVLKAVELVGRFLLAGLLSPALREDPPATGFGKWIFDRYDVEKGRVYVCSKCKAEMKVSPLDGPVESWWHDCGR